ncbi:MAG: eL32 family ribosomal protein [Nanoarchaeota archaeon]
MNFLRRSWYRFSRLGKGRKKKQKWRNPTGRHNKLRNKRKGYSAVPSVGYSRNKKARGKIEERIPMIVYNVKDLGKIGKNGIAILGKVGRKKKLEIAKKAKEMKMKIVGLNIDKLIKKTEKKK